MLNCAREFDNDIGMVIRESKHLLPESRQWRMIA